MKAYIKFVFLASLIASVNISSAQVLDEETGFIYVKAEYLYETGRYDEAISQYNQVITKDPKYKDALLHRGWAKYAMAAYKGAKMDAIQSIDLKGITAEASALLGRAFAAMQDDKAAIHSLSAAVALDKNNAQYFEWRAKVYEDDGQRLKACQDYETAMNLGSASAEVKARNYCGVTSRPKPTDSTPVVTNPTNPTPTTDPNVLGDNEVLSDGKKEDDSPTTPAPTFDENDVRIVDDSDHPVIDENLPKNDDSVNSFVIDEDLSIEISGQELGKRQIKEVPSILILADENGKVCINFCVNKEGTVTSAEFNGTMSTIAKKSLVSLALRKAKEFEFTRGKFDSQCGIMVFNIKRS